MNRLHAALCPVCRHDLDVGLGNEPISCGTCQQTFPRVAEVPVLVPNPEGHLTLWRQQLALLNDRGQRTFQGLREAADEPGVRESTRFRLKALGHAVQDQVEDIARILQPVLGGPAEEMASALPRGVVEYIGTLYRDWGWPASGYHENEQPLATLGQLLAGRPLGQTLILGAGACGLGYELHLRHAASQTVAVDIDPYLLMMAERVVRGHSVKLTEASLRVMEACDVSRQWTLQARAGPLPRTAFACLFADGTNPPFAAESFDTVVTPWFIDQVPRDLAAFFSSLHRLVRPGGCWLNQGPLIYPEKTPFENRYTREELFELARVAGFRVENWSRAPQPYLVSPLSGNGKIEAVLSFIATR